MGEIYRGKARYPGRDFADICVVAPSKKEMLQLKDKRVRSYLEADLQGSDTYWNSTGYCDAADNESSLVL